MNNVSVTEKTTNSDYYQVTNIRFVSMITIVAMHSEMFKLSFIENQFNVIMLQILKFGTLSFFIISGFLLGNKLSEVRPFEYFKRRLHSTFRPWLFWASLFSLIALMNQAQDRDITFNAIVKQIIYTLFYSNYWFVINFLFALGILLIFRKYFQKLLFSFTLLLISLFYGINIYFGWISSNHTTAVFGYIFYIWMGIQISIYKNQVIVLIKSVRWHWFILAVFIFFLLAILEARVLFDITPDYLSSLRISNQIYSLVVFFTLVKIRKPISPSWMKVRHETYGIYLIHWLILDFVKALTTRAGAIFYNVSRAEFADNGFLYITPPVFRFFLWIAIFAIVYFSSWFITKIISKTNFSGIVGVNHTKKNRH